MNRFLLLYKSLPAPARLIAANLRGAYLYLWRYGPASEGLVEKALERDTWSPDQWKKWQEGRLAYVLNRAATQVPYYREQWQNRRRQGDHASWEYLENWPILKKQTLRENPIPFVADDCQISKMFCDNTSGTTGTPLKVYLKRNTIQEWYALFEARIRRWNGVSRRQPWAILGGQPVVPSNVSSPPFWAWNRPMQQLYLSANHISEKNAPAFVDALHRYKITHIIAYTSSATFLAHQMLQLGLQPPATLKVILTNAEPLFDWQRQTLQEGFKCAVRETYGMAEIVTAASADQQNRLRLWLDCGLSEVLKQDTDQPGLVGETGRLVGTGLLNADMPLIRYEVGDLINLLPESPPPQDTIQLPFVGDVQGRISDMLVAEDGRRVFWLNPVFYGLPITEAQIMQEQLGEVQVNYVPGITFASDDAQKIVERIRERLGASTKVTLTSMAAIPRGANNKFQPVICRLSQQLGEKLP